MIEQDGGSAFPYLDTSRMYAEQGNGERTVDHLAIPGMSLRDYFAGQVLAGLVANPEVNTPGLGVQARSMFAEEAYAQADAMLKERAK